MCPPGRNRHRPQKRVAMHDIAIQRNGIHRFSALMTAPPTPDDNKAGLNVGLMMPMLKNDEMRIQIGPGMAGGA